MPKAANDLITFMAELREQAVLDLVSQRIAEGMPPWHIIELCHKGMARVGELYEQGYYFISGLIMAGEIMRQVGQMVLPLLKGTPTKSEAGRVVLGTVGGDIHFIGKDIFMVLVRVHGFTVHDLGVDVPPERFLSAVHEYKPDIVGLSCLISSAYSSMRETIALLRHDVPESATPSAIVIGGQVDEGVCKDVGADGWTNDAMKGVRLCQRIINPPC